MEYIGMNPERLRIEFMSAGEGILFTEVINDFGKKIKELGPLGKGEGMEEDELKFKLEAVASLVPYIRLVQTERLRPAVKSEKAYRDFYDSGEADRLFHELIADKLAVNEIVALLRQKPHSTGEISEVLGLNPSEVSKYLTSSSRQGLIRYDEDQKCFALA
jgi:DNA-binding transcriptional ArsR family regulator